MLKSTKAKDASAMTPLRPRVFIGASTEARIIVDAVVASLNSAAVANPWFLPNFRPTHDTLSQILGLTSLHDFGLFIMSPDDELVSRDQKFAAARDNVLIELGIFLGSLGQERTFALIQETNKPKNKMKIPSDLLGINIARLPSTSSDNLAAECNAALTSIRIEINKLGFRHEPFSLRRSSLFRKDEKRWVVRLDDVKLFRNRDAIRGRKLVLLAMLNNTNNFDDRRTVISEAWTYSDLAKEVEISCGGDVLNKISNGDTIHSFLFLVPGDVNISKCATVNDFISVGCRYLDRPGQTVHGVT